jgi:hypothetical protein
MPIGLLKVKKGLVHQKPDIFASPINSFTVAWPLFIRIGVLLFNVCDFNLEIFLLEPKELRELRGPLLLFQYSLRWTE